MANPKRNARVDSVRLGNVTIYKRENGIWYADYSVGNRRIRESIRTRSKKVAIDWATDKNAALVRGEIGIADDRVPIERVVRDFLVHQQTQTSNAPSTFHRYRGALRALQRFLSTRPRLLSIGQLDVETLEAFRSYRLNEGRDHKTVDGDMAAVSSMLSFAVGRGHLKENSARRVKPFRVPKPRPPVYTQEDVQLMIEAAEGDFRDVLIALAGTGLRIGELEHLEWSDVDLEAGRIHIRIKKDWRPKDKAERTVPINPEIRRVLESRERASSWVFTDGKGRPVRERRLLKQLRALQAEFDIKEGGLHTFRHYFVSRCAASGIDPYAVMSWVGHADLKMVLHYFHLDERHASEAMRRFRM